MKQNRIQKRIIEIGTAFWRLSPLIVYGANLHDQISLNLNYPSHSSRPWKKSPQGLGFSMPSQDVLSSRIVPTSVLREENKKKKMPARQQLKLWEKKLGQAIHGGHHYYQYSLFSVWEKLYNKMMQFTAARRPIGLVVFVVSVVVVVVFCFFYSTKLRTFFTFCSGASLGLCFGGLRQKSRERAGIVCSISS